MGSHIVSTVTDAIGGLVTGLTSGISDAFNGLFVTADGTGLSNLAVWGLTFVGVTIILGVVKLFTRKLG